MEVESGESAEERTSLLDTNIEKKISVNSPYLYVSKKDHITVKTTYPIDNRGHILLALASWILVAFDFKQQHPLICTEDEVTPVIVPPKTDPTL